MDCFRLIDFWIFINQVNLISLSVYNLYTLFGREHILRKKIQEIVEEHPEGLFKNTLIQILEKEGIASRMTIYKHLGEYADKNGHNIIEFKKIGKRRICFPTIFTMSTREITKKLESVNKLLEFIDNNPTLGNYVITWKNYKKNKTKIKQKKISEIIDLNEFLQNSKKFLRNGDISAKQTNCQNKIIKELSFFLVDYINREYKKHSEKLRDDLIRNISDITKTCLKIHSKTLQNKEFRQLSKILKETMNIEKIGFEYDVNLNRNLNEKEFEENILLYQKLVKLRFEKDDKNQKEKIVSDFIECFLNN